MRVLFFLLPLVINPFGADIHHYPKWVFASVIFSFILLFSFYKKRYALKVPDNTINLVFAWAAVCTISWSFSSAPGVQIYGLINEWLGVLICLFIYGHKNRQKVYAQSIKAFLAVSFLLSLVSVVFFAVRGIPFAHTMGSATPLSHLFMISAGILLVNTKLWGRGSLAVLIVLLAGLGTTFNRLSILLVFIALFFSFFIKERRTLIFKRKSLYMILALPFLLVLVILVSPEYKNKARWASLFKSGSQNALYSRGTIYANTLKMIKTAPFLGKGPGGFTIHYPHFNKGSDREVAQLSIQRYYAHCHLLQLLSETGTAGFIIYAGILALVFIRFKARYNKGTPTANAQAAAVISIITLSHGMLDIDMEMAVPRMLFWLSLGYLLRVPNRNIQSVAKSPAGKIITLSALLLTLAVLTIHFVGGISRYYLFQAEKHAARGAYAKALVMASRAGVFWPWSPAIYYARGHYYHMTGRYQQAQVQLEHCLKLAPLGHQAWVFYAMNYLALEDTSSAIGILDKALAWDSNNYEALHLKGNIHYERGNLTGAEACYLNIIKQKPALTAPRFQLALLELKRGNVEKAKSWLKEIRVIEPKRSAAARLLESLEQLNPNIKP